MRHLIQLRTFVEAYRHRSLTRAAERLSITQPAASGHIKGIEALLGRSLFRREARGMAPTAVADELAALIGPELDALEAKLASLQLRSTNLAGSIHLVAPAEYLGAMIAPRLAPLWAEGIRVHARSGNRDFIYAALSAGQADLAITASRPPRPFAHVELARERWQLVLSPSHAKALRGKRLTPRLLAPLPLIAYDMDLPLVRELLKQVFNAAARFEPAATLPDLRSIAAMLMAGPGWSVLPDYLCRQAIAERRLLAPELPRACPANTLHLAWNPGALRHPRTLRVRDFLLDSIRGIAA